jgi:hypothetical protein
MYELLLFRNMHDCEGADIPIIVANWEECEISRVMDYWSELIKGEWSDGEKIQKCK